MLIYRRALPPQPQGRGVVWATLRRSRCCRARLRSLAQHIQLATPTRSTQACCPGQPLSAEPARLCQNHRSLRICSSGHRAPCPAGRSRQPPRAAPSKSPKAFRGKAIAFRPTKHDGVFDVVFRTQMIATIDIPPPRPQPRKCPRCLRTPVHLVPGLNNFGRGAAVARQQAREAKSSYGRLFARPSRSDTCRKSCGRSRGRFSFISSQTEGAADRCSTGFRAKLDWIRATPGRRESTSMTKR
jgi:hypothetical protein